jgi:cold-inducible RNA-binding protein
MQKKLFIGNLSVKASEEEVAGLFAEWNPLEVKLVTEKESGSSRGFAFVTFRSPEDAQAAIDAYDGQEWMGRQLAIKPANDKPRDNDRRGGGRDSMR